MNGWRIYYDDGQVFSSAQGAFEAAPVDGVLYVLQRTATGVKTLSGADYYAMIDGEVIAIEDVSALLRSVGWIKCGRWTSFKRFEAIGRHVAKDAKAMTDGC